MSRDDASCLIGQWPGMTLTQALVLNELIEGRGRDKPYEQLEQIVFDIEAFRPAPDTIRRAVYNLRKHGHVIKVVHGLGYRLVRLAPDSGST
jgi:DNA-binding response OmpR family regulator